MAATVKSVLSGDTIILRGRPSGNQPPPERQLNLAYIQAPRLGNPKKEDEPFAFESREYLRRILVGKEVRFRVDYTIPDSGREYGNILCGENVAQMVVKEGWAKVREDGRKNKEESRGEDIEMLVSLESEAKSAGKGIWQDLEQYSRNVNYTLQEEAREYLDKYKGLPVDGIIEQVRDGSSLRVLFIPPSPAPQQLLTINISGIKAPTVRKNVPDVEDLVEPFGEESKFFVETRILQRDVKVILEGLSGNNQAFFASIFRNAGNIAEALLSAGLAKVADRSITLASDGPTKLRAAENLAKEKQLKLWKDHIVRHKAKGDDHEFEGTVTRIVSGDTIFVRHNRTGVERKLQLSSIRQPKPKDQKFPEYNFEAKELLRKRLIGKTVKVTIDYNKPATEGFEARDCATVRIGEFNAAEALLERGLAHIIRHKRDDEDRSSFYDQLNIAEQKAQTNAKGIHSPKDPPVYRISDASENVSKAKQFLHSLQRSGRIPGVVDYVANASRFKIYIPKESYKLTFVLGGVRAPRLGRNPSDKSEPFAAEASEFATRRALQRDVEIEVENVDKTGGFIGTMWIKNENFAVMLLQDGFATVHDYSASQSPYSEQLYTAQENAKAANKNIWSLQDNEIVEQEIATTTEEEPRKEYIDITVTEIISGGRFYLQIINDDIHKLEKMMSEFSLYHKNETNSSSSFTPRNNEMVSAQFTEDNQWYRAKIRKVNPDSKSVEVIYSDYGNSEVIPLTRVRPLPDNFKKLPSQSQEAVLSFLNVRNREDDYGEEAYEYFRDIVENNKRLVANIDYKESHLFHLTLFNPNQSQSTEASINAEMVKAGYATVDKKSRLYRSNPTVVQQLLEAHEQAKKDRAGMFEYGDITADDE